MNRAFAALQLLLTGFGVGLTATYAVAGKDTFTAGNYIFVGEYHESTVIGRIVAR